MNTIQLWAAATLATCSFATQAQGVNINGTLNGSAFSAGVEAREASAAELGLPVYPGAVPQRDKADDSNSASLGLHWGNSVDVRLVVLKFASTDSLADVAAFYRKALARQGAVLDCSGPAPAEPEPALSDKQALRCGKDRSTDGALLYKVGTRQQMRLVSLQPVAGGVRFQLVRLSLPAD